MNALSSRTKQINWSAIAMFALGFWLSASFLVDLVIIPSLSRAGMMATAGFASAGYLMFGAFNHLELVCAALVLTSVLALRSNHSLFSTKREHWSVISAVALLMVALVCTYFFTPHMSGWGLQLNLFEATTTMPPAMISLHEGYWSLEVLKFVAGGFLLRWCYQDSCNI